MANIINSSAAEEKLNSEVSLKKMSLLADAIFDEESATIRSNGGAQGYAVYGPFLSLAPGVYEFCVDIEIKTTKNPRLYIDIYQNGVVLSKLNIAVDCRPAKIRSLIQSRDPVEIRVHTFYTGFVMSKINIHPVEQSDVVANVEPHKEALKKHLLLSAIGFKDEPCELDGGSAVNILDDILRSPRFLLLDDTQIPDYELHFQRSGIDPAIIQNLFVKNNSDVFEVNNDPAGLMNGHPAVNNFFQFDILRDGTMEVTSPFGPGKIQSRGSFPVLSSCNQVVSIIYEFADPSPIFIGVSASWIGSISFIWIVENDLMIYNNYLHWYADWVSTLPTLREFVKLCVRHRSATIKYRREEKTVACLSGFLHNMGHYFWNDISGVERVLRAQYNPTFLTPKSRWLSISEIFQSDNLTIREVKYDADEIFRVTMDSGYFVLRPTGNAIDSALSHKVQSSAVSVMSKLLPERLRNIEGICGNEFVLYFNLRAHNKSWIEQVEGAVQVVNGLTAKLNEKNMILFLDGYKDCEGIVREISSRLVGKCLVYDGTDISFAETIFWAYRCDIFVAVIGSGLVPLTWLAGKPGVCHGDRRHLSQMSFWSKVRLSSGAISFPPEEAVIDVVENWYTNYSLSPSLVAELTVKQFDEIDGGNQS